MGRWRFELEHGAIDAPSRRAIGPFMVADQRHVRAANPTGATIQGSRGTTPYKYASVQVRLRTSRYTACRFTGSGPDGEAVERGTACSALSLSPQVFL